MQKKLFSVKFLIGVLFLLTVGSVPGVLAQPSDAQTKKDLTGAKTVSVTLGNPGKVEWSSTYKKYVWNRSFTAKVKSDYPDIFVVVKGYASYDVMGGRYVFWRSFITSNSYDGIPDPTAADVQAFIAKFGVERFMGNYDFNHVIGKVESLGLADEPKFTWHTPNSVSFNVVAVFTKRTNDVGGRERIAQTYEIRLYRDDVKQAWKNMMSTPRDVKRL
jgi:hypothetical protein